MQGEDGLSVFGEEHEVGFPMTCRIAGGGLCGALGDGDTAVDKACRTAAFAAAEAALALAAGKQAAPAVVLGACDLSVDETVDGLMADDGPACLKLEPAGDLLGRPAAGQA